MDLYPDSEPRLKIYFSRCLLWITPVALQFKNHSTLEERLRYKLNIFK